MCYVFDCAANITFAQGVTVGRIADVCFACPWWAALIPLIGAVVIAWHLLRKAGW